MSPDAIATVVENARRVVKFVEENPWDVYRAVAPLFISAESYAEGLKILQEAVEKLQGSPDIRRLFPEHGYTPGEIMIGHMTALSDHRVSVMNTLQVFAEYKSVFDHDKIQSDVCYDVMINLMNSLLLRFAGPGANEKHLFKLAIYFAHSRTHLFSAMRSC